MAEKKSGPENKPEGRVVRSAETPRTLAAPGQPSSLSDAEYALRTSSTNGPELDPATYDPATMKYTVEGSTSRVLAQARMDQMRAVDGYTPPAGPTGPTGPTGP